MDPFDVPRGMMGQTLRNAYRLERHAAAAAKGETVPSPPPVPGLEGDVVHNVFYGLMSVVLFFTAIGLVKALASGALLLYDRLPSWSPDLVLQIVCAALILALGYAFYWIRENWKWAYVCMELGAAVGTALVALPEPPKLGIGFALPFLASVYIAVRGFDNWGKAVEGAKKKAEEDLKARAKLREVSTVSASSPTNVVS